LKNVKIEAGTAISEPTPYCPAETDVFMNDIQETLVVSLARIISDQYLTPTVSYDALIRHAHLHIGSVVYDPWDDIKYRVLEIMGHDVAECEMRVKLCEILE
jgi:hypothetical protein